MQLRDGTYPAATGFDRTARRGLTERHQRFLEVRAVAPEVAAERGYWTVESPASARGLGYRGDNARPGLAIPLHTVWGASWSPRWTQLRPDEPVADQSGKLRKYLRPVASETVIDVHPRSLDRLSDRTEPVVLTEGIPKADSLTSLGFVTLGLLGVDCWVGNGGAILPDLKHVTWKGRQAIIAFDSDARTNPRVQDAARRLAEELKRRGAEVYLALPPAPAEGKLGWDDHIARLKEAKRTQQVLFDATEPIEAALPRLRPRLDVVRAENVEPEPVHYLWSPYIPLRKLTMVDGDAGLGKTFLLLSLAAAMSRGGLLPGGTEGEPVSVKRGGTLYLSLEDGVADTLVPRYLRLGGDPAALRLSTGVLDVGGTERAFTLRQLDALDAALAEHGPRLVVLDPLLGFLGADVDANRSNETRPLLAALGRLAARHHCAVVGIRHTRKSREGRAVHAGLGTVDISAAARSVVLVAKHPTKAEVAVLAHTKPSTSRIGASLEFAINEEGKLTWDGVSAFGADDLVSMPRPRGPQPWKRDSATEWVKERLASAGDAGVAAGELYTEAAPAGHSESTVKRALANLGAEKIGRGKAILWRLKLKPRKF